MTVSEFKKYECTVLIDASCGVTVEASSPEEAAELAENAAAEQGAGSLCHQCSDHTECGDSYAVIVYDGGEEVLDTDYRSGQLKAAQSELAALREELAGYRAANMVLRDELKTERLRADAAVGDANDAERSLTAAELRNSELEAAIKPFADYAENTGCPAELGVYGSKGSFEITRADWKSIASIKPTESGASE